MTFESALCIAMAVLPSVYLVRRFYRWDARKPEPKGLILWVFFWGFVFVIPAALLEVGISWVGGSLGGSRIAHWLFRAFIVAGLCEEYMKLRVVMWFAYKKNAFDEVMDGVVYAATAGLGFACLENILYVMAGGMEVALIRAFTAVPMHAFMSGLMGYFVGRARFARSGARERRLIRTGLLAAVVVHGTYDFLLFAHPALGWLSFLAFPLVLGTLLALCLCVRKAKAADRAAGRS